MSTARFSSTGVAAAPAAIGGDHQLGACVFDAVLDGVRGKAAENHRVHGADAGARVHGDHRLGNQRHVNDDAVAASDAERLERIGEPAHLAVQLGVGEFAHIPRLTFENDRDLRRRAPANARRDSCAIRSIDRR